MLHAPSVVITFHPHPAITLGKAAQVPRLSTTRKNLEILDQIGIDYLCLLHFSPALARVPAGEFLQRTIIDGLEVQELILGSDARVGVGASGDFDFIRGFLAARGVSVQALEFVAVDGVRVSSRRIREQLAGGAVESVRHLLGRPYVIMGHVQHGEGRGRSIGFPTANIACWRQLVPARGVYVTSIKTPQGVFRSVTNIGTRPTFEGAQESRRHVEAHILNFPGTAIYGACVELAFLARIRDEIRFPSVDALRAQIALDAASAENFDDRGSY